MADQDRGERVKLGIVRKLTSQKTGRDWFVGNVASLKILILPMTQKNDEGRWDVVDGRFEVFLQEMTPKELEERRAYFDGLRNGGGGDQRSSSSAPSNSGEGLKKQGNGSGTGKEDAKSYQRSIDDEIPF